jgi:hypothetical protein
MSCKKPRERYSSGITADSRVRVTVWIDLPRTPCCYCTHSGTVVSFYTEHSSPPDWTGRFWGWCPHFSGLSPMLTNRLFLQSIEDGKSGHDNFFSCLCYITLEDSVWLTGKAASLGTGFHPCIPRVPCHPSGLRRRASPFQSTPNRRQDYDKGLCNGDNARYTLSTNLSPPPQTISCYSSTVHTLKIRFFEHLLFRAPPNSRCDVKYPCYF